MHGGVPNKEFNENNNQCILDKKLSSILNGLAIDRSLLDNPDHIQHIMFLLQAGADPNTKGQDGKTPLDYLNEELLNILNQLAIDRGKLNDYIRSIISLLQAGADPNTKGQDGKTPLDYLNEELLNILNQLAIDSNLLDNSNNTQYIMLLLGTGANPNVRNQAGKTLLHYVAERNDVNGIRYFLGVIKANPSVQDHSGKTPFEYVTEPNCLQALKDLGYISNSTKPSDCDRKDEDSSCSSSDYLFLEDSLLAKLGIPLTTDEKKLIDKFCEKIRGITAQNKQESEESILKSIEKIVDEYLEEGIRLNSSCSNDNDNGDKETVTSFIFKEMEGVIA